MSPDTDSLLHNDTSSEEQGQASEGEDPMADMNELMKEDKKLDQEMEKKEFDKAMAEFATYFKGEEEKAEHIKSELAKTMNASLRLRPLDNNIQETAAKKQVPLLCTEPYPTSNKQGSIECHENASKVIGC